MNHKERDVEEVIRIFEISFQFEELMGAGWKGEVRPILEKFWEKAAIRGARQWAWEQGVKFNK